MHQHVVHVFWFICKYGGRPTYDEGLVHCYNNMIFWCVSLSAEDRYSWWASYVIMCGKVGVRAMVKLLSGQWTWSNQSHSILTSWREPLQFRNCVAENCINRRPFPCLTFWDHKMITTHASSGILEIYYKSSPAASYEFHQINWETTTCLSPWLMIYAISL